MQKLCSFFLKFTPREKSGFRRQATFTIFALQELSLAIQEQGAAARDLTVDKSVGMYVCKYTRSSMNDQQNKKHINNIIRTFNSLCG